MEILKVEFVLAQQCAGHPLHAAFKDVAEHFDFALVATIDPDWRLNSRP
jgi:hypothetical protein